MHVRSLCYSRRSGLVGAREQFGNERSVAEMGWIAARFECRKKEILKNCCIMMGIESVIEYTRDKRENQNTMHVISRRHFLLYSSGKNRKANQSWRKRS